MRFRVLIEGGGKIVVDRSGYPKPQYALF
jgi:hypothetical protein